MRVDKLMAWVAELGVGLAVGLGVAVAAAVAVGVGVPTIGVAVGVGVIGGTVAVGVGVAGGTVAVGVGVPGGGVGVGVAQPPPTTVNVHPPEMEPLSPPTKSTTYRCHTPLPFVPAYEEAKVAVPPLIGPGLL
jgi:hypothetical protein